ncbi:hypothetical protein OAO34_03785 [Candidatus Poseidoniaceae archaeon]|nr:hypothetical protein [Candidatus Poseidoniaceae archaeon]
MIPLISGAFSLLSTTVNAVSIGATAGMTYGLGRKYGRKICELADNIEGRAMNFIAQTSE